MHQKLIIGALLAVSCTAASALSITAVTSSPGLFTNKANVCTVNFNTAASLTSCVNATYSASNGILSHIVSGDLAGQYAQPANDPTPYLTVGGAAGGPVQIAMTVGANYFGFYAGSIDSYNSISFSGSNGSLTLSGTQILAFLGNSPANGSTNVYFNIFTDTLFSTITLSSTQAAFETDNHSFGVASVPEPGSVALLGLGGLALFMGKRRRAKQAA